MVRTVTTITLVMVIPQYGLLIFGASQCISSLALMLGYYSV